MCCNSHSHGAPASSTGAKDDSQPSTTRVSETTIAMPLPDGYWIEQFPFTTDAAHSDIIAYGLGFEGKPATIKMYINPLNTEDPTSPNYRLAEVAVLDFPVGMTYADLTGNGYNDIIIADRYGPSMGNLWTAEEKNGGRIVWLENPGNRTSTPFWTLHEIGNSTGMHRVGAGHFTTKDVTQVLGLPIIPASNDLTSPAPILVFTPVYSKSKSGEKAGPVSWEKSVAFDSEFRLIHDYVLVPGANDGLDIIVVAGREGITALWFDQQESKWTYNNIGTGLPQSGDNPYWGSGSVTICANGDDDIGYIATCEAFHGNVVSIYVKGTKAPKGPKSLLEPDVWTRVVIDDYGPLDPEGHTGTIHHVHKVRLNNKNPIESFGIACMGAPIGKVENQGVYLYTPSSLTDFQKQTVTGESAARLAVGPLNGQGTVDIASISYFVPGYHTGPDPSTVRINDLRNGPPTGISAARLDKEILLRIPRPSTLANNETVTLPMWKLAGKKISMVILPASSTFKVASDGDVKIINGKVNVLRNGVIEKVLGLAPEHKGIRGPVSGSELSTENAGAVFLHIEPIDGEDQGPFGDMRNVQSQNILPNIAGIDSDARWTELPFIQVEDLAWASSGLWNDFQFFNVTGWSVFFNDDAMEKIAHIQAWTLGLGETARFHNHSDQSFCEIHYCLSNGGGSGGMRYFPDDYTDPIDTDLELTKEYVESNSTLIVVGDLHEHGPLWKIVEGTEAKPILRANGTVDYPWHAWLSSEFGDYTIPIIPAFAPEKQRFDVWLAFEFPLTAFQY